MKNEKPILYGIKNCDTMKKARRWLDDRNIDYHFHDYKKDGISTALIDTWLDDIGHDVLINRRGTTFRKLPEEVRTNIDNESARRLMLENPSIIKRPVLTVSETRIVGFSESTYRSLFSTA